MRKAQIQKFIDVVYPDVTPIYYHCKDKTQYLGKCSMYAEVSAKILGINTASTLKKIAKANDGLRIKGCLLHEFGHFALNHDGIRELSKHELEAHLWAINKAIELCMFEIARDLFVDIEYWGKHKWNDHSGHRRYRIAHRMSKYPSYQRRMNKLKKACNYKS